jgi:hypothetical protein
MTVVHSIGAELHGGRNGEAECSPFADHLAYTQATMSPTTIAVTQPGDQAIQ